MSNYIKKINLPLIGLLQDIYNGDATDKKNIWKNYAQVIGFSGAITEDTLILTDASCSGDIWFEYTHNDDAFKFKLHIQIVMSSSNVTIKVEAYVSPTNGISDLLLFSYTSGTIHVNNATTWTWTNAAEYIVIRIVNMAIGGYDLKIHTQASGTTALANNHPFFLMDTHTTPNNYVYGYSSADGANRIYYDYGNGYREVSDVFSNSGGRGGYITSTQYIELIPLPLLNTPNGKSESIYYTGACKVYYGRDNVVEFYSANNKTYALTNLCYSNENTSSPVAYGYEVTEWIEE